MYTPIQVAVRINSSQKTENLDSVPVNPIVNDAGGQYIQAGAEVFPVSLSCPHDISQSHLYTSIIQPNISVVLEGYDASVITYGQTGTGKTYTIFGPGIHCAFSETEHGIIPRTLRDIFSRLGNMPERSYVMHISWFQIFNNEIKDLFNDISCNVQINTVSEAFYWLQQGLTNLCINNVKCHSLFTICLEQQWINTEGLIQHRLSTMSFCDLAGTQRSLTTNEIGEQFYIPLDNDLQNFENIIKILSNPNIYKYPNYHNIVPYSQSILTTLLMDSLGGRAKTVLICCVSPLPNDLLETIENLRLVSSARNIKNQVIMNTFSDNNTQAGNQVRETKNTVDMFGLQFASSQWLKLVSNAEGLFNRLISNKMLSERDAEQIEEWLFLKQECDDCLSSGENITKQLGSIQEETPQDYSDSVSDCAEAPENSKEFNGNESHVYPTEDEVEVLQNMTDTEGIDHSDSDSHKALEVFTDIENIMKLFREMTVHLTKDKFENFILSLPKSTINSTNDVEIFDTMNKPSHDTSSKSSFFSTLLKDMGKSFTKASVNSEPVYMKARRKSVHPGQLLNSVELQLLQRAASSGSAALPPTNEKDLKELSRNDIDVLKIKYNNAELELESIHKQIDSVKETICLKAQLLKELAQNNEARLQAKQKFTKKKSKLEHELINAKKHLVQASNIAMNCNSAEANAEVEKWKIVTEHYEQRLKDIFQISGFTKNSEAESNKLENSLYKLNKQLVSLNDQSKKVQKAKISFEKELKMKKKNLQVKKPEKRSLKDVTSRISHLDQVLKQKSQHLLHAADTAEQQSVRTEIRNLRKTRDHLQEQRTKLKNLRSLDLSQQRRLLECDEAIEAIDTAIEVKNERICGKASILDISSKRRDEGERMLMARLNKLTLTETRTLLYKYFQKVIDLKDSGHRLEKQVLKLEAQQEAWEHTLNDAVREAILKGERNAVYLQHQHQQKLNLIFRHLADETNTSSNTERDRFFARDHLPLDLESYAAGSSRNKIKPYYNDLDIYAEERQYKHHEKKVKEPKNKLLAKLVNYSDRKSSRENQIIPTQNLKQLQTSPGPTTKVTRQKNKLIIQQNTRK